MLNRFVSASAGGSPGFMAKLLDGSGIPCEIILSDGKMEKFGEGEPRFRLIFHHDKLFKYGFDELTFGEAYMNGEIDIEGDMAALLQLRTRIRDKVRFSAWFRFIYTLLFHSETAVNRRAINDHYQRGNDLYLSFIDQKYRFYSHGIFHSPDESIEEASEHKLENMYVALQLRPGMRLLDIGGGWGGVAQYCGSRGVHVTELTLAPDSYAYISQLIEQQNLPCEVILQDFLTFHPPQPYDAIVIYGVIEHIINYRRFCERVRECLRPDGRLFLDASASVVKYDVSSFIRNHIWSGTHTFLCLQDLIREMLLHGLEVVQIKNESRDYGLTMLHWAQRLDENRKTIVAKWGEKLYRAFRLYLWGGSQAFPELLQAYHVVARRMEYALPPPGRLRRFLGWVGR